MTNRMQAGILAVVAICAGLVAETSIDPARSAHAANRDQPRRELQAGAKRGDTVATQHAAGPFDVKIVPQGEPDKAPGSTLARMSIEKQYHGDLEATATGQMLSAGTDVKGSAGYVAIERVTGKLGGRSGSFVLQHSGTLTRGTPVQNITVVPDSGTGELLGLTGKLTVIIEAGKHSYDFEYALTPTP
jgi:Protein of unknown function (DUF3224)